MKNEPINISGTKIDNEGMDNLVAVFSLLLKWDKEQNPENYKQSIQENDNTSRIQR